MGHDVDGVDAERVTEWLSTRADVTPPLEVAAITGGRSNLTYRLTDAGGTRWVLRRPPLHSVLASAHDVGREHRIMAALRATDVPVPPLVGHESGSDVTGAPFYVMEFVDGVVPRDVDDVVAALDETARAEVGRRLADTLADLHAVDVDAVGLGDLARRTDYVARQLHRWSRQYEEGGQRELPAALALRDRLAAGIPEQGPPAIVHGDYRLDNLIVGADGTVRAVLDWELCTLGDPMADLGLLVVYWSAQMPGIPAAGRIPGMAPLEDVLDRYADRAGRDLGQLDYFVAFGYWKLALVLEGVYTRFSSGAYGTSDGSHEMFGRLVLELLERADEAASRAGL